MYILLTCSVFYFSASVYTIDMLYVLFQCLILYI